VREDNDSGVPEKLVDGHLNIAQDGTEKTGTENFAGMNWNVVTLPSSCLRKTWSPRVRTLGNRSFPELERLLCLSPGEDESYRNLLDANEFQWADLTVIIFQAQLNHFASALHESVEVLRLRVAASQAGDCRDVVAVFVPFNDHREFAMLHWPILA
jgi:hypothetical protein